MQYTGWPVRGQYIKGSTKSVVAGHSLSPAIIIIISYHLSLSPWVVRLAPVQKGRAPYLFTVMLMPILPGSPVITTSALLRATRAYTTLS